MAVAPRTGLSEPENLVLTTPSKEAAWPSGPDATPAPHPGAPILSASVWICVPHVRHGSLFPTVLRWRHCRPSARGQGSRPRERHPSAEVTRKCQAGLCPSAQCRLLRLLASPPLWDRTCHRPRPSKPLSCPMSAAFCPSLRLLLPWRTPVSLFCVTAVP